MSPVALLALGLYIIPAFLFFIANVVMLFASIERDSEKQNHQALQAIMLFVSSFVWVVMLTPIVALLLGTTLLPFFR